MTLRSTGVMRGAWRSILPVALAAACGGDTPPARSPDAPQGPMSEQLGAPYDTRYSAEIEAQHGRVRVIVREESMCDVIPVTSVIENGEKRFIAGTPTKARPCNEKVARNVTVSLEVEGNTYRLGEPDQHGELVTNLSDRMLQSLYGSGPRNNNLVAKVMLRDRQGKSQELGSIPLTQLEQTERRLDELLAEFRTVLDRPQEQLSGAELARAYELYEQLARFDTTDPRVAGLMALFLERLYHRKALEANERFRNNLDALNIAKDILIANRETIIIPGYVSTAIEGGVMDQRTADWARGQVAIAIRRNPTICGPSPQSDFTWSRLNLSQPPAESRLAFEVLRFAYDNPYEKEITQLCRRVLLS